MVKQIIILGAAALLLAGCSARSKRARSAAIPAAQPTHAQAQTRTEKVKREKIVFLPVETEHVSITHHNPFDKNSTIAINLTELAREFRYPYPGNAISHYGMRSGSMHTGLDIKAIPNDTIRSILPGVVRMSKNYSSYGNIVVVYHYNGLESVYSHNSRNLVVPNQIVEAGTPIALAGRTGRATTEHLHLELRIAAQHFNPEIMIDPERRALHRGETLYFSMRQGKLQISTSGKKVTPPAIVEEKPAPTPTKPGTARSNNKEYTVRQGDTLYSIANRHGTTVEKLRRLNNIGHDNIIITGQRLKIK